MIRHRIENSKLPDIVYEFKISDNQNHNLPLVMLTIFFDKSRKLNYCIKKGMSYDGAISALPNKIKAT